MGILDNHKKKTIRYEKDDIKLFEPTMAQREEITKLISNEDNIKIDEKQELRAILIINFNRM